MASGLADGRVIELASDLREKRATDWRIGELHASDPSHIGIGRAEETASRIVGIGLANPAKVPPTGHSGRDRSGGIVDSIGDPRRRARRRCSVSPDS